jgi:tetratricopeptide (TPR) repeat protein
MTASPSARLHHALLLVAMLVGSVAWADEPTKAARGHFRQGQSHFELGEFQAALDEFKEAYRLWNDPALLFNIGQCQVKLGDDQGALHSYRSYLRKSANAPNRSYVEGRIAEIERRLKTPEPPAPEPPKAERALAPHLPLLAPPPPPPTLRLSEPVERPAPSAPIYTHWWLWTGLAVIAASATTAILLTRNRSQSCGGGVDYCSSLPK